LGFGILSWRLMIVPVLRTTGVNTNILVSFELSTPDPNPSPSS
jgi:hypothetical protein